MPKFLIDANLPYYFSIWKSENFIHVFDINDAMTDEEIWEYAGKHNLTIITKDADFSIKALFQKSPPSVIHLKIGNMKLNALYEFIYKNWREIEKTSGTHTLTNVYVDRIEGIE
jgi:predicted nuclease of predicted toxin-antitoxin system